MNIHAEPLLAPRIRQSLNYWCQVLAPYLNLRFAEETIRAIGRCPWPSKMLQVVLGFDAGICHSQLSFLFDANVWMRD